MIFSNFMASFRFVLRDFLLENEVVSINDEFETLFWTTWHSFSNMKPMHDLLSASSVQVIESLVNSASVPYQEIKIHILQLMVLINDGTIIDFSSLRKTNITCLESAYILLCHLLTFFPQKTEEIAIFKLHTIEQAVYVCCRHKNFDLALAVFHRLRSYLQDYPSVERKLTSVLQARDSCHPELTKSSYSHFYQEVVHNIQMMIDVFVPASLQKFPSKIKVPKEVNSNYNAPKSDLSRLLSLSKQTDSYDFDRQIWRTVFNQSLRSVCPVNLREFLSTSLNKSSLSNTEVATRLLQTMERLNILEELMRDDGP